MTDRHKTKPKAVRMPDGLLARVEVAVKTAGETVNAFIVAAIEEKLQRREGKNPAPAQVTTTRTHALNCKCPVCKPSTGGKR